MGGVSGPDLQPRCQGLCCVLPGRYVEAVRSRCAVHRRRTSGGSTFLLMVWVTQNAKRQDIFQFFSAQLLTNLRPSTNTARPLQPSRRGTNQETQSQPPTQGSSQRVTDVPYYSEYCYLLESLATIKSVVLACDVPGGEELVTGFFEGFIQIVR